MTREQLLEVVETNDKRRFALSPDGRRIRASQGHSVDVDLGLEPREPLAVLYHGTAQRFLESILRQGLNKRSRGHVHLSADLATAERVGVRHGTLALLEVDAARMHADGFAFFLSANGVWLVDHVPVEYLSVRAGG